MDKEQYIKTDKDSARYYSDEAMTILHREDGPAVEVVGGYEEWRINGKLHREDGPAITKPNRWSAWYLNGKCHREAGPAIEWRSGVEAWYLNGERMNKADMPKLSHSSQA